MSLSEPDYLTCSTRSGHFFVVCLFPYRNHTTVREFPLNTFPAGSCFSIDLFDTDDDDDDDVQFLFFVGWLELLLPKL